MFASNEGTGQSVNLLLVIAIGAKISVDAFQFRCMKMLFSDFSQNKLTLYYRLYLRKNSKKNTYTDTHTCFITGDLVNGLNPRLEIVFTLL